MYPSTAQIYPGIQSPSIVYNSLFSELPTYTHFKSVAFVPLGRPSARLYCRVARVISPFLGYKNKDNQTRISESGFIPDKRGRMGMGGGIVGDILSWSIAENFETPYVTMRPRTAHPVLYPLCSSLKGEEEGGRSAEEEVSQQLYGSTLFRANK